MLSDSEQSEMERDIWRGRGIYIDWHTERDREIGVEIGRWIDIFEIILKYF